MSRGPALRLAIFACLIAAVAYLAAGAAPPTPAQAGRPPRGARHALVAAIRSEPRTFNRLLAADENSHLVSVLTQAKLVRINNATQALEPALAESWTASADHLVYTLKLRKDVRFSDDAPFTADDVIFTFQVVYDPKVSSTLRDALLFEGKPLTVAKIDLLTVRLGFPEPFGPGLRVLDNLPILARHRLEPLYRAGKFASAWTLGAPPSEMAGLGPFILAEYTPAQRLVFHRNPNYWRREADGARLPRLDSLTLLIVPDQNAETLRFLSGDIDLVSDVRLDDYAAFKRQEADRKIVVRDVGVDLDPDFLWFNLNGGKNARTGQPYVPPEKLAWFRDLRFRRAVAHAIDRKGLADAVFLGRAVPVWTPITPGNRLWYTSNVTHYDYDPNRSRELLKELGFADRNRDGRLEDGSNRPVRFTVMVPKGKTSRERSLAVVQEDLRRVGIGVDIAAVDFGSMVQRITATFDYEACYFGPQASDVDPASNLDFWRSSGAEHFWNPSQAVPATPWEKRIDELMTRNMRAADDAVRRQAFGEVQAIFAREIPCIYVAAPQVFVAARARVRNLKPALLRPRVLWNADDLDMEGR